MLLNNYQTALLEAGLDEAGRGCYAGPVFAAAVVLPKNFYHPLLNDSKQLTEAQRELLAPIIKASAITWAIAKQSAAEIDASNILKAAIKCMHLSLDQLKPKAKFINTKLPVRATQTIVSIKFNKTNFFITFMD